MNDTSESRNPTGARARLMKALSRPLPESDADEADYMALLDAYRDEVLHDAAERIRVEADQPLLDGKPRLMGTRFGGMHIAANLIDPAAPQDTPQQRE